MGSLLLNTGIRKLHGIRPLRILNILFCVILILSGNNLFAQCPALPVITADGPLNFCNGDSVLLSSNSATGNQWLKDGKKIKDGTQQTLLAKTAGIYTLQVSNGKACTLISLPVIVTVNASPPKPTIKAGGPTVFCGGDSVKLTSSAPTGNQWLKDGVKIQGAVSKTWVVKTSGSYQVSVSNGTCQSLSDPLLVNAFNNQTPLSISPAGPVTICNGESIVLSSSAEKGNQWFKNGIIIRGATLQTYTALSAGNYTVQISSPGGCNVTSSAVTINIGLTPPVPVITVSDTLINCVYSKVLYSSSKTGNQWFRNGILLNGEVDSYYIVNAPGSFTVLVTNGTGCSSVSAEAIILILINPYIPVITTTDPLTFCNGGSALLHSSPASGYQWYKDGALINGAISQNYKAIASGSYSVQAIMGKCRFNSLPVNVSAINNQTPATISPPGPLNVCNGENIILSSSSASGNQWYKDGIIINGATKQTFSASVAGSYTVKITVGACSTPFSSPVIVSNNKPQVPVITVGGPLTFCTGGSVLLTSSLATSYQWYREGLALPGATGSTYSATVAGSYSVSAKSAGGCQATSAPVVVVITTSGTPPIIAAVGPGPGCVLGETILISSADLGNQWLKNGIAIPGAVLKTYSTSVSGNYSVALNYSSACFSESQVVPVAGNSISENLKAIITANNGFLYSDSVKGNQWYLNDTLIEGARDQAFIPQVSGKYTLRITNSNGCTSTFSDPYFAKVENFSSPNVLVFPNPVSNYLFVVNLDFHPVTARIFDIQGKQMLVSRGLTGTNKINLSKYSSGSYVIQVTDEVTGDKIRNLILKY